MTSREILSERARNLVFKAKHQLPSTFNSEEFICLKWPFSTLELYFSISNEGILNHLYYNEHNDLALKAFMECTCELSVGQDYQKLSELSAREMDYFLRDEKSTPAFEPGTFEVWCKYLKKVKREIDKVLLKKSSSSGYTYSQQQYGAFRDLSDELKQSEVLKAIEFYCKHFFEIGSRPLISLIDVEDLVVVVEIQNFHDTEHILENLREYLNDVFDEEEFNTIAEY